MSDPLYHLGVCFSDRQLYYAVGRQGNSERVDRIGKIDFNFDILSSISSRDKETYPGIVDVIDGLVRKHGITGFRCAVPATFETWSALPKSVYDQPSEREAYLRILCHGQQRSSLEPYWHGLSNRDFRFMSVRNRILTDGFSQLGDVCSWTELCSEFEIGQKWVEKTATTDAIKTVACFRNHVTIASFVLGKLRAATYIRFRHIEDLPYLWLQQTANLGWMNGVHDTIVFHGTNVYKVKEVLQHVFDRNARQVRLDNLSDIRIQAPEETYGFNLEEAFPAISLAL